MNSRAYWKRKRFYANAIGLRFEQGIAVKWDGSDSDSFGQAVLITKTLNESGKRKYKGRNEDVEAGSGRENLTGYGREKEKVDEQCSATVKDVLKEVVEDLGHNSTLSVNFTASSSASMLDIILVLQKTLQGLLEVSVMSHNVSKAQKEQFQAIDGGIEADKGCYAVYG
ncbi:hypothetical protein NDU88_003221 [Pleurodeles waltl]|uniref:Uncharacterized protein n=1 Tax=Pleurodeles waltl TaxID=8319 RepID=A0AAV7RDP8_PLEWA|nr:hypothetical protein NDU88_003221 [Pleurodeles waltl]